jgi:hypothetical protein
MGIGIIIITIHGILGIGNSNGERFCVVVVVGQ